MPTYVSRRGTHTRWGRDGPPDDPDDRAAVRRPAARATGQLVRPDVCCAAGRPSDRRPRAGPGACRGAVRSLGTTRPGPWPWPWPEAAGISEPPIGNPVGHHRVVALRARYQYSRNRGPIIMSAPNGCVLNGGFGTSPVRPPKESAYRPPRGRWQPRVPFDASRTLCALVQTGARITAGTVYACTYRRAATARRDGAGPGATALGRHAHSTYAAPTRFRGGHRHNDCRARSLRTSQPALHQSPGTSAWSDRESPAPGPVATDRPG